MKKITKTHIALALAASFASVAAIAEAPAQLKIWAKGDVATAADFNSNFAIVNGKADAANTAAANAASVARDAAAAAEEALATAESAIAATPEAKPVFRAADYVPTSPKLITTLDGRELYGNYGITEGRIKVYGFVVAPTANGFERIWAGEAAANIDSTPVHAALEIAKGVASSSLPFYMLWSKDQFTLKADGLYEGDRMIDFPDAGYQSYTAMSVPLLPATFSEGSTFVMNASLASGDAMVDTMVLGKIEHVTDIKVGDDVMEDCAIVRRIAAGAMVQVLAPNSLSSEDLAVVCKGLGIVGGIEDKQSPYVRQSVIGIEDTTVPTELDPPAPAEGGASTQSVTAPTLPDFLKP